VPCGRLWCVCCFVDPTSPDSTRPVPTTSLLLPPQTPTLMTFCCTSEFFIPVIFTLASIASSYAQCLSVCYAYSHFEVYLGKPPCLLHSYDLCCFLLRRKFSSIYARLINLLCPINAYDMCIVFAILKVSSDLLAYFTPNTSKIKIVDFPSVVALYRGEE